MCKDLCERLEEAKKEKTNLTTKQIKSRRAISVPILSFFQPTTSSLKQLT